MAIQAMLVSIVFIFIFTPALLANSDLEVLETEVCTTDADGNKDCNHNQLPDHLIWDPSGYVFFCMCMGRIGNQIDHFLGGMAFAKAINRTLVLPPFHTYKNFPFREWFKVDSLRLYHRIVEAEEFMTELAPKHWPPGKRVGYCWLPAGSEPNCRMKEGSPFGPFWDGIGVDFDKYLSYQLSHSTHDIHLWKQKFPAKDHPVLALRGSPAAFPVAREHRALQQYLQFADSVVKDVDNFIAKNFPDKPFIGLHLRNGLDWVNACKHGVGQVNYMASPQCTETTGQVITEDMCLPSDKEVLRLTKQVVESTGINIIAVATDHRSFKAEIELHLKSFKVKVYHMDPWLPVEDLALLTRADHFIGNCVSSFSAFVKRARDVAGKPTSFWGMD